MQTLNHYSFTLNSFKTYFVGTILYIHFETPDGIKPII